jgi:uncharacterized protein (TIGR02284 family)
MQANTDRLNNLIETLKDGEYGFQAAAEDVTRSDVKQLLQDYSLQRAEFAQQLQDFVSATGEEPEDSGTFAGTMHRGWINMRSAIADRDEAAVLEECERGEDAAVKAYEEALNDGSSLGMARDVVSRQFNEVRAAHDRVRSLRDQYRSVA